MFDEDLRKQYPAIFIMALIYCFICGIFSIAAWNSGTPSPILNFFGYQNWFFRNSPCSIEIYILSRPWHIVPLAVSIVSFFLVLKVLLTGKCSLLKGLKLLDVVMLNYMVALFFIAPMAIEIIISTMVFLAVSVSLVRVVTYLDKRFDSACECEKKENSKEILQAPEDTEVKKTGSS